MIKLKGAAAALVLAVSVPSAGASVQPPSPATSPEPALGDPMPERVVRFDRGVTALADIVFSTIPGFRPVTLDLYNAEGGSGPKPLVIYVHGGGWMGGHTRQSGAFSNFPAVLSDLASRGYVVASLEYRLSREAPFPAAIDDVRTAIRFLRANAGKYGIDVNRVAIWGGSAGGQLAALAATDCGGPPTGDDKSHADQPDCVQAAVGWYGVYDFSTMPRGAMPGAEHAYLDCETATCPPERLRAASPAAHVDGKDPPMLLIHGSEDKVVPASQSRELAAKLQAAKVPFVIEVIPAVGHSWIGADEAATRAASLKALGLTFDFFDRHLKSRR